MWFDAFDTIATGARFKLVLLAKEGCPAPLATYRLNNNGTFANSPWPACSQWHKFVIKAIKKLKPSMVVVSTEQALALADPVHYALPAESEADMLAFLKTFPAPTKAVVLGGFPEPGKSASPTLCLSKGPHSLRTCSFVPSHNVQINNTAIENAASADSAQFINQTPWLCAKTCPAVINGIIPYTIDGYHIDDTYTHHLVGVLWASLEPSLT